jgi:hypothetical protein
MQKAFWVCNLCVRYELCEWGEKKKKEGENENAQYPPSELFYTNVSLLTVVTVLPSSPVTAPTILAMISVEC